MAGIRTLFESLCASRELIIILARRDFTVKYRQSLFGWLWAVLPQLVTVTVFGFLANQRVFLVGETHLPYLIHALWSVSLWQLFAGVLTASSNALVNAGALVTKINFNKEALVLSSASMPILDFLIRLLPLAVAMIWTGFKPSLSGLLCLLIVPLVVILALSFGFLLSILNLVIRDIGNVLNVILGFGVFFAPILYPPPETFPLALVNFINPFSPLLIATQECIAGVGYNWGASLWLVVGLAFLLFYMGWNLFRITIPRVVERA